MSPRFKQAQELHQTGRLSEARAICLEIVGGQPSHAGAWHILGIIAGQQRDWTGAVELLGKAIRADARSASAHFDRAVAWKALRQWDASLADLNRAIELEPDNAEAYCHRGNIQFARGKREEAILDYDRTIAIKSDHARAWYNRGVVLADCGRWTDAAASNRRTIEIEPNHSGAQCNLGVALEHLGAFESALACYDRALQIDGRSALALANRGNVLRELQRPDEALASCDRAIAIDGRCVPAHVNRGNVLRDLGQSEAALASYDAAISVSGDHPQAHKNRAVVLYELNRFAEALGSCDRAISLKTDFFEAYLVRADVLRALERWQDALVDFDRALSIRSDYAEAWHHRGEMLEELSRFDDALASYERALRLNPDIDWLYGAWLHARMLVCEWHEFDVHLGTLIRAIDAGRNAASPFVVLTLTDSPAVQRTAAQTWVRRRCPESRNAGRPPPRKGRAGPIRVGYYSADFHNHATAYLMAELFERHDRKRFEVVAFSYGPEKRDDMRTRLSAAFDRFIDVRAKTDAEVSRLSRDLGIDVAVDLKGFTTHARTGIFSRGAAPIQVSYLGYPGTMGTPCMDYLIADRTLIPPESRGHYLEKIVFLPDSYQANDRLKRVAAEPPARAALDLPPGSFVFCCFNNSYKITPGTFDSWMRILRRVEGSVIWLLEDSEAAARNLRREAEARGVKSERLIFARRKPLPEHLARHALADLFIDTLPYNAHTTASDALWAGLPVLTCAGESFAARVAASLLQAIGLSELIAASPEQYVAMAVELASNPVRLLALRETLRKNRTTMPLFDTERFTRHLEDAYAQMHERCQSGAGAEDIYVAR